MNLIYAKSSQIEIILIAAVSHIQEIGDARDAQRDVGYTKRHIEESFLYILHLPELSLISPISWICDTSLFF